MKSTSGFKKAYLIFLAACVLLSAAFLIYVGIVVKDFDKSQPEHIVREKVEWLSARAADGTLTSELDFETLCTNRYEQNDVEYYSRSYIDKIKGAAITYEFAASQSSELSKTYTILADSKPVGTLALTGTNSRSRLFFFNMADWEVENFTPLPAETVYNFRLYLPEGTEVFVNGVKPSDEELDYSEEVPAYSIKGILHEPVIEYKRLDGTPLRFIGEKNVLMPVLYDYNLSIPSTIKLSVNGKTVTGEPDSNGKTNYSILEMTEPSVTITDVLGNTQAYDGKVLPEFYDYEVVIPESFSLAIDGKDADTLCTPTSAPHPDAAILLDLANVNLPKQKTYTFSLIKPDVKASVTDAGGAKKDFILDSKHIEISSVQDNEIPENITAQIDVMKQAKTWSLFMTDDLEGEKHGLAEVQKMFIKDSDYYNYAYAWATGVDIDFTSDHTTDGFKNEKISNFTQYNDKCFSCEVYFEKKMTLYSDEKFAGYRTDVFNSIMYFVLIDDTPDNGKNDPHWAIAAMHDVV
ncbi:MAG: hypothetical protein ACI4JS_00690 [Oscillospiraceae bacterium]